MNKVIIKILLLIVAPVIFMVVPANAKGQTSKVTPSRKIAAIAPALLRSQEAIAAVLKAVNQQDARSEITSIRGNLKSNSYTVELRGTGEDGKPYCSPVVFTLGIDSKSGDTVAEVNTAAFAECH